MSKRYQRFEPIPDRWFISGIGITREQTEFWFFRMRLPSWGYGYDIAFDELRWGQRVLFFHGHQGFSIRWRFPLDSEISEISVTPQITGLEQ